MCNDQCAQGRACPARTCADLGVCQSRTPPCAGCAPAPMPVEMFGPEPLPYARWLAWLAVAWMIFSFVVGASLLAGYWSNT